MTPEDDPALWELLGKSPAPKISPFFARNVVRAVRNRRNIFRHVRAVFARRGLALASAAALAIVVTTFAIRPLYHHQHSAIAGAGTAIQESDEEVMLDIDDLVAADDASSVADIWTL